MKFRTGLEPRSKAISAVIAPFSKGETAFAYISLPVGVMIKAVRKSAKLTITVLGGADAVPMAERKSDRTTIMRVNDVTMMRMVGASDKMVTRAMSCNARSVAPPVGPRSRLIDWALA